MIKHFILLLSLAFSLHANSQDTLSAFENVAGSTWVAEGKQLGGHDGRTVKEISWGLDGKLVKVKTYTTDPKTLQFGLRNEGVRILNAETGNIEFYEFDKFGGISSGQVIIEGKNLHYQYAYGDLTLRDSWIFVDKDTYTYTVASIKDQKQDQVYHSGTFKRQ